MEEYLCNWKRKVCLFSLNEKQDRIGYYKNIALQQTPLKNRKNIDWKRKYVKHITDKGLPAGIYKESLQFNKGRKSSELKNRPKIYRKSKKIFKYIISNIIQH